METKVYDLDGSEKGSVELSDVFTTAFRPDIIRKAVSVAQANRRQPYGASPMAGRRHTSESWGPGRGASRVPRGTQRARATMAPSVVGGRRAHPPRAEKKLSEKINKKERRLARASALAATADRALVTARGHKFDAETVPLVVEDALLAVATTADLLSTLENLGVGGDVLRAKLGRHQRAGKGKMRGRRLRKPRSLLLVLHEDGPVRKAAGNLPGVDVALVPELNVERLAPGGDAGRLVVFTRSAIQAVGEVGT